MVLNVSRVRQLLRNFDFTTLFIDELGWDHYKTKLNLILNGEAHHLVAVAQKRGMVAFQLPSAAGSRIPEYAIRCKIERQLARAAHEHLIIFTDAARTTQIWQWVKREPGKPLARREHSYHKDQPGDALIQKLQAIAFTIEEEESVTLVTVTGRVRAGFDIERVTKRFYEQFKKEHAVFLKFIGGIPEQADHEWYASVMLNRLMFVYFIQRKGFLDGDDKYLRNRLERCRNEHGRDKFYSFYRYFLLRLFHEGLGSKDRTPMLEKLLGRIPYLNGGMFEKHPVEQRYKDIQIPDKAFEHIFDYFDQYHWHLDERPLRADNEINPDVLGYIFEKYINQKQMGAYYTKEDITEYITKNTLLPLLLEVTQTNCKVAFENAGAATVWDLLKSDPTRYIFPAIRHGIDQPLPPEIATALNPPSFRQQVTDGSVVTIEARTAWNRPAPGSYGLPSETWRDVVARRDRYKALSARLDTGAVRSVDDFVTLNLDLRQFAQDALENSEEPELLRAFWHAIGNVRILDPTCGSGAFLFAALNILESLYEACLDRMEAFVEDLGRSPEKHRLEEFSDLSEVLARIAAHPNRRYFILKSIILNNLFGVDIMEEAVEICKLRLFLKLASQVEPNADTPNLGIEPLPDIDFNIRVGNTLVGYATYEEVQRALSSRLDFENAAQKIEAKAGAVGKIVNDFRTWQIEGDAPTPGEKKDQLRSTLKALDEELNRYLATDYKITPGNRDAYSGWLESHRPFHWFVEFHGIMKAGGFDVIVGNPPYVEYRNVRDTYSIPSNQYASEPSGNLYAFCMERSCRLLKSGGWCGMIVPTAVLGLDETKALRDVLFNRFNRNWFSTYSIRPSKLFDGVDQRLCVCLETNKEHHRLTIQSTRYQHWNAEERSSLFPKIEYAPSFVHDRLKRVPQVGSAEAANILAKLESRSRQVIAHYYSSGKSGLLMHYHRSPRYWIRAMDFEQYFKSPTRTRSVHHFRDIYFADERVGRFIGALLNSTLFFFHSHPIGILIDHEKKWLEWLFNSVTRQR
jgi:hypothetical protein